MMKFPLLLALCFTPFGANAMASTGDSLALIENLGQYATRDRFVGKLPGMLVRVEPNALGLQLFEDGDASRGVYVRLVFEGASEGVVLETEDELPGRYNWFRGSDPAKWVRNARSFGRVRYRGLYEGVDLEVYRANGSAKYDLIVAPGADLEQVGVRCEGVQEVRIDAQGRLCLETALGDLVQPAPLTWTELEGGKRLDVACDYRLDGPTSFGFHAGARDPSRSLVIDPEILWGSYVGSSVGTPGDFGTAVAFGPEGDVVIAGVTAGTDFPMTPGTYQAASTNGHDGFAARFDSQTGQLVYSSVFGGNGANALDNDRAFDVEVDARGAVVVVGWTNSDEFPTTPGAFDTVRDAFNISSFVLRLTPAGDDLEYSTFLEGSFSAQLRGLDLSSTGAAIVTGRTGDPDYPTTTGAFQEDMPGIFTACVVTRLDPTGSLVEWSTYLGGSMSSNESLDLAVGPNDAVTVVGFTGAEDFPTTPGSFEPSWYPNLSSMVFVTRLAADGSRLEWSGLLGSGANFTTGFGQPNAVALAPNGDAVVAGFTNQRFFPTTPGTIQPVFPTGVANPTGFVTRISDDGASLVYSTFLGTPSVDFVFDVAVDSFNRVYVAGSTKSSLFPVTADAIDPTWNGSDDAFLVCLNRNASALLHSTFLGTPGPDDAQAIAVRGRTVALAGTSFGPGFPTTPGAFQPNYQGGQSDAFVAVVSFPDRPPGPKTAGAPGGPSVLAAIRNDGPDGPHLEVTCTDAPELARGVLQVWTGPTPIRGPSGTPAPSVSVVLSSDGQGRARVELPLPAELAGTVVRVRTVFPGQRVASASAIVTATAHGRP